VGLSLVSYSLNLKEGESFSVVRFLLLAKQSICFWKAYSEMQKKTGARWATSKKIAIVF
jgi:hypothetical protein